MSGGVDTDSSPGVVEFSEAVKQRANPLFGPLDMQFRDIMDTVSQLPHRAPLAVKEFRADAAGKARNAASAWLRDFTAHGPLDIQSVRTSYFEGKYITVVAYSTYGLAQEASAGGD